MQDLVAALEARREEIRHYLKSADEERGGMIKQCDELSERQRRAENDLDRVDRALRALTGEDLTTVPRAHPEELAAQLSQVAVPFSSMPYFPGERTAVNRY